MPLESRRIAAALGRILLALGAGIASGALLVAAFIYSSLGAPLVFEGLLVVSLYYGAAIATICVPIWLILARLGWDGPATAAALGFVATAAFLVLTYSAGSHQGLPLMSYSFVPYAACGAAAALITWWVGRLLQRV